MCANAGWRKEHLPDLSPGPRDHLLTRALREAIAGLDPELISEDALDPAEAPDRLARHLMAEVRRALDGEDSADTQAEQVNALLAEALPVAESESAEVVLPARILQGISERSPLGSVAPLPPLPATRCRRATCWSTPRASPMSAPSCAARSPAPTRST